jgi:catechol 2,3-dioxygenase-like lactoylglutathione lyase family enzyme
MSTTTTKPTTAVDAGAPASTAMTMRLEVATLPVADVDRAKAFYLGLGWRLDIDFMPDPQNRVVQITPTGSPTSIQFGSGPAAMTNGALKGLFLVVENLDDARAELISHGAEVSEVFHVEPGVGKVPGADPQRRSYFTRATFTDPDGNEWLLQEITERLPGRVDTTGIDARAQLLHETAERHEAFEAIAPPHDWWDWYAAYQDARELGSSPEVASAAAGRYLADVKHVVVSPA